MKNTLKLAVATLIFPTLCALGGQSAKAQCGGPVKKMSFNLGAMKYRGMLKTVADESQSLNHWGEERDENGMEPIVGLWKIDFVDKSKNYEDKGYAAWHADFTEFQNSERTPSTGAVCQGVWEKVGRSTYRLNHYALAYGDNTNLTNVIRIREEVVVDKSRKSFAGVFITDVYDTQHNLIVEFKGPITGKRVTINSGIETQ